MPPVSAAGIGGAGVVVLDDAGSVDIASQNARVLPC